jgi:3-oxoacyl-[acyl-carrier protein] reductase
MSAEMLNFTGQLVVVTGATKGIGKAIAELYLSLGAKVLITGRGQTYDGNDKFIYHTLDSSCDTSVREFIAHLNSYENIDVLVNNAGINRINRIEEIHSQDFDEVINVNLRAPFYLCQAVASKMIANGKKGKILNISSIWSVITREGRTSYISSKSGLAGLTRGLATDLAKHNVLVNSISPGFVGTELTYQSLTEDEINHLRHQIPMNRLATPSEIANHAIFMTSGLITYMTGQNLIIDGGYTNV